MSKAAQRVWSVGGRETVDVDDNVWLPHVMKSGLAMFEAAGYTLV
jgi:hypothetical protein